MSLVIQNRILIIALFLLIPICTTLLFYKLRKISFLLDQLNKITNQSFLLLVVFTKTDQARPELAKEIEAAHDALSNG